MKSKILKLFMLLIIAGLATITACGDDDDPGLCTGVYATEDACKDAIKGADNCKCEPENDVWIAVPD